jgi:hypothetical protein
VSVDLLPAPTLPEVDLDAPPPDPDEHEPVAHVVKTDHLVSAMFGEHDVVAACGKKFKPKLFNPPGLKVCPACKKVMEDLRK